MPMNYDELDDDAFIEQLETGQLTKAVEDEEEILENTDSDEEQENQEEQEDDEEEEVSSESEELSEEEDSDEDSVGDEPDESEDSESDDEESSDDEEDTSNTETKQKLDYKSAYEEIMAPFKANGKTIEIKNAEEVKQLMRMGANYTKKMQEMAQHRKILSMLDKNNLLDEGRLSYLIDLDKKDPAAIKELIKEADIDPLDIDLEEDSKYTPNKHIISDNEDALKTKLDYLKQSPEGSEVIQTIYANWDSKSKDALWDNPDILDYITEHKRKGYYDQIAAEVDRQRALGHISPEIPFIQAYGVIGNSMTESGTLVGSSKTTNPVNRRVVTKQRTTKNVQSARLTKSSSRKVNKTVDYDNLDDESFMKLMDGRV